MALPSLFNGQWVVGHSDSFSATITTMQLVIWVVTFIAMLALTLFIRYSRMGRACRACAEDLKMASLLGINTDRVIALTFVIGAAMAAVAGVLLGQFYGVINPYIGFMAGMKAFTAAVLGGIGSIPRRDDRRPDPRVLPRRSLPPISAPNIRTSFPSRC